MKTKTCGECKHCSSCCSWVKPDINANSCEDFEPKTLTNGDKIRQMSDEELAELLTNPPCFICSKGDAGGECTDTWANKNCKEAILAKLKTEAKNESKI